MRSAVKLHRPAGQQQSQNDNEKQLFLFRQAFHGDNLTGKRANSNNVIYEL
jgi:hypothetical protein